MTEFLFVRHAEAVTNTTPERIGGQSPSSPLTEKGREQARLLGDYLQTNRIDPDLVFTSGAVRTNETAAITLASAGIEKPVTTDSRLLEISQGVFEGELRSVVYTPENIEKYNLVSMAGKLPGGESVDDGQQRMVEFVQEKSLQHPDKYILVVSHGFSIRALAGKIRGFSKEQILTEITHNASLTSLNTSPDGINVHYVGKNVIPEYT